MRPPTPAVRLVVLHLVLLAALTPSQGAGQSSRVTGASVERFYLGEYHFTAVNFRRTDLTQDGAGLDLAAGFVPDALAARVALLDLDVGLARALQVGPAMLVLKGGVSSFAAVGGDANFLYPGVQAGLAIVIPLERRCGLRLDLGRSYYFPQDGPFQLWSIGVGLAVLRR